MREKHKKLFLWLVTLSFSVFACISAIDNAHFYKAAHLHRSLTTGWFDEVENYENFDWLTKIDANYAYGDAKRGWDHNGSGAPLLNLTGNHNMLYLMENVPQQGTTFQSFSQFIANAKINHADTNSTFGQLEFHGKFVLHEFNIDIRQNLVSDFFAELHIPIRNTKIKDISYVDKSPTSGCFTKNTFEWKQFLNQLNTLLSEYGLKEYGTQYDKTSFGDISLLVGWQGIFETDEDDPLTFGITLKGGLLLPTGEGYRIDQVFTVPTGYNEHWGVPLRAQFDFGLKKWLSFSAHGSALFFFDDTKTRRMKTFYKQVGYIKLWSGRAEEEKGTLWHLGLDAKFDHVLKGLSTLIGYSYNRQENDTLIPKDTTYFDRSTVNGDPALYGWHMHVFHLMVDYDFSVHMTDSKWAPRLNVFYNYPFDGKNAFKTDMIGGGVGLDLRWNI